MTRLFLKTRNTRSHLMLVQDLEFTNYKNLQNDKITFGNDVNIIYGNNAQGKTNLIEAIWLFSGNRSFRGVKDSEYILFGQRNAQLALNFMSQERLQQSNILFSLNANRTKCSRYVTVNEIPQKSMSGLIGKLSCVIFSPTHLSLVKGSPAERRKFLNAAVYQIKPSYGKVLSEFNEALIQRNALLKDIPKNSSLLDTLDIWDKKISNLAGIIIYDRLKYISILNKITRPIYSGMSSEKETIVITYSQNFNKSATASEISEFVFKQIQSNRTQDLRLGFTTIGPHRDDIDFFINDIPSKSFASQGQQRSIVLALKLAEADILCQKFKEPPVMLLDDVMSELDELRQNYILNSIRAKQIFITCCEPSTVTRLITGKVYNIDNGKVREE